MPRYYKITSEDECRHGLQYADGLVVDPVPFQPSGDCAPGGIYFVGRDIFAFLGYGPWVREVTLPPDAQVYENPGTPEKWKADRVILGPRRRWSDPAVMQDLLDAGADVHADEDYALRRAAADGHADCVRLLLDAGADVHAGEDLALRWAAWNGHADCVRLLLDAGADVHADADLALRWAAESGHADCVRLLLDAGADVHAGQDNALRWAARNNRADCVKMLQEHVSAERVGHVSNCPIGSILREAGRDV